MMALRMCLLSRVASGAAPVSARAAMCVFPSLGTSSRFAKRGFAIVVVWLVERPAEVEGRGILWLATAELRRALLVEGLDALTEVVGLAQAAVIQPFQFDGDAERRVLGVV